MRKLVWLLAVTGMVACAGDGPHEIGPCDDAWNGASPVYTRCERVCEVPPAYDGPSCSRTTCATGDDRVCSGNEACLRTMEIEGRVGCCMPAGAARVIQFYECVE